MNEVNGIASAVHKRKFCPKCGKSMVRTYLRSEMYINYYAYRCDNLLACCYPNIIVQGEFRENGK